MEIQHNYLFVPYFIVKLCWKYVHQIRHSRYKKVSYLQIPQLSLFWISWWNLLYTHLIKLIKDLNVISSYIYNGNWYSYIYKDITCILPTTKWIKMVVKRFLFGKNNNTTTVPMNTTKTATHTWYRNCYYYYCYFFVVSNTYSNLNIKYYEYYGYYLISTDFFWFSSISISVQLINHPNITFYYRFIFHFDLHTRLLTAAHRRLRVVLLF